jgi:hypothetical protein
MKDNTAVYNVTSVSVTSVSSIDGFLVDVQLKPPDLEWYWTNDEVRVSVPIDDAPGVGDLYTVSILKVEDG